MFNQGKKISVVIPTYNEEGNIKILYQRLLAVFKKINSDYEIIFADNKSTDKTRQILRELAGQDRQVAALFFSRNFGTDQYGLTAGTDYASGDAVIWIEADLQDPPELIEDFVRKWEEGYQVVYGVRTKRRGSLFLQIAYKLFYRMFRKLSYLDIPLDAGDFSLMDRKVVDVIKSMPERDRFVRGLRTWAGFKSIGVSYTRDERHAGVTSNSLVKNIWWAKKAFFSFSYKPLEWISYVAGFVTICSILTILVYIPYTYFVPGPPGFLTTFLVMLFLGSIQLLSLSVIAEYLTKIFEEVKGRPKYVIEEIVGQKKDEN